MIKSLRKGFVLALLCFMAAAPLYGAIDHQSFEDEELHQRYLSLVKELRCPKCQNQNIADSNSPIATDLRKQVYVQLKADKSDQQIINYMVERYGQFIIYRPPARGKTLMLWIAPLIFVLLGLGCVVLIARRSQDPSLKGEVNEQSRERLKQLLNEEEQG